MRPNKRDSLIPLTLLAAASGARATAGVAAISPRGGAARLLAVGEVVADKMPELPDRIDVGPLIARVAAGALVGSMVGDRLGMNRGGSAVLGGLIAFAATHATFRMRRFLSDRTSPLEAAFIEDVIVGGAAVMGARHLRSTQRRRRIDQNYLRG